MQPTTLRFSFNFVITITDTQLPIISGQYPNININNDPNAGTAIVSWTPPTASDNSGTVSLTSTHQPGDAFFIGVTNITYTAVDSYSNQATLVLTIIVTGECSFSLSDVPPGVIKLHNQ